MDPLNNTMGTQDQLDRLLRGFGKYTPLQIAVSELSESERKDYKSGRKIFKTDSHSRYILVDNPDRYSSEGNGTKLRKLKRRPTNITPKKKKRKK